MASHLPFMAISLSYFLPLEGWKHTYYRNTSLRRIQLLLYILFGRFSPLNYTPRVEPGKQPRGRVFSMLCYILPRLIRRVEPCYCTTPLGQGHILLKGMLTPSLECAVTYWVQVLSLSYLGGIGFHLHYRG